jgi:hypothetical protein
LREILQLYDFRDSDETRSIIKSILSVKRNGVVGRVGGEVAAGFCRGVEVNVKLAEENFAGSGVFLFASVLERFFGFIVRSIPSRERWLDRINEKRRFVDGLPERANEHFSDRHAVRRGLPIRILSGRPPAAPAWQPSRRTARAGESARYPVGEDYSPGEEMVRFHSHVSHSFPPSEIVSFTVPTGH